MIVNSYIYIYRYSAIEIRIQKIVVKTRFYNDSAIFDRHYDFIFEALFLTIAEGEGFKPPIPVMGIPDFESSAFGHSANLPKGFAKVIFISDITKLFKV